MGTAILRKGPVIVVLTAKSGRDFESMATGKRILVELIQLIQKTNFGPKYWLNQV